MTIGRPTPAAGASILVVSQNSDVVQRMARALDGRRLTLETASLASMNGRASALVAAHDVVLFDVPAGDAAELGAVSDMLARPGGKAVFVALADEQLSIAAARRLREAGIGEVLPNTIDGPDLARAIDALLVAGRAPAEDGGSQGTVIAVAQACGGLGSTTVAVNLAQKLLGGGGFLRKRARRRVALVDLDLQFGGVAAFLDLDGRSGLLDLVEADQVPDATFVSELLQTHGSGLQVLTAPAPLVPLGAITPETAGALLNVLRDQHDFVVVDLPRVLVEWVAPVLRRTGTLALVTDTTVPAIRQAKRLIDFYREQAPNLAVEVIVNRESRPMLKSQEIREAEKVLGQPFAHWLPDCPKEARKAADLGRPVVDLYPSSGLARAIAKLADATAAKARVEQTHHA